MLRKPNGASPQNVSGNFMTTFQNITFFALTVGLFSCNSTTDNQTTTTENKTNTLTSLAGQVYFYAPELDTTTCKATGACDCCSGNILFLTDSIFLGIDICEANTNYSKGHYHFDNDFLVLTTDSLQVDEEYNWEKETDTTGTVTQEYFIKQSKTPTFTQKLSRFDCKNNIGFIMGDKEKYFVTPDNDAKITNIIGQLKKDSIWDKLEMK